MSAAIAPWPPPSVSTATRPDRIRRSASSAASRSAIWVGLSTRWIPAAAHAASTTCEAEVSAPVCDAAPRTAASERPGASRTTGLPASTRARAAADERPSVDHVLGVQRDGPGARMGDAGLHQVDHAHVGLVADGHEPCDTQAPVLEQCGQVEHDVAALAEHRHVARWQQGVGELEAGAGVDQADAVRPDQHDAGSPGDPQHLLLRPHPVRTGL